MTERPIVTLPYDPRLEALCPSCGSPGTEYHPAERYGRCHTCGFRWVFAPYRRTFGEWKG
jgi:DNA-directed RNA polymerase subunit RPC12/RpoP